MSAANEISIMLINTLFSLVLMAFVLRLLLQLVRADFYNPISQTIVKFTNPVVLPLRRAIPPIGRIDSASLIAALLIQALTITLLFKLYTSTFPNPAQLIIWSILGLCSLVIQFYFLAIIGTIIMSWIAQGSYHPAAAILHQLTEPVMAPFRKLIPPLGGLDLSPILVFLSINVIEVLLRHAAASVGLYPALVFGL
ncbi:YggT family protein [Spongiibacter sp. KMU-158]|uniref:YggT family protein n=1 Tax=Spongiibacter pelagi TaxID=2760804 RepID=A0A927BZG9_9GAMM|nr:YggT family protein [Spongiibacter pelagi]MBD2857393.1 YggT family protein [Spongiibacter pelagi]